MKYLFVLFLIIASVIGTNHDPNNVSAEFWGRLDQCLLTEGNCDCLTELVEDMTTEDVEWVDYSTGSSHSGQDQLKEFFCRLAGSVIDYEYHISNTGFSCKSTPLRAWVVLQQLDQVHTSFFSGNFTFSQISTIKYMGFRKSWFSGWKIDTVVSQFVQVIPDVENPTVLSNFPYLPFDYKKCEIMED